MAAQPCFRAGRALRLARRCYGHMAGRLAIAVADTLTNADYIVVADEAGLITDEGRRFFCDFGIDLEQTPRSKRPLCRTCLDWSERRPHIARRLGAALLGRVLDLRWIPRTPGSRALRIIRAGELGFGGAFGLPSHLRTT